MNMDNVLYQNNHDNFYVVMVKGDYYNSTVELLTFNNKIISNEEMQTYKKLEFNKKNIQYVLLYMNVIDIDKISLENFDVSTYNYITYKNKLINLNNWVDFYNFAATLV
jgi:hypothetical protein